MLNYIIVIHNTFPQQKLVRLASLGVGLMIQ